jgi:hypothetical protein
MSYKLSDNSGNKHMYQKNFLNVGPLGTEVVKVVFQEHGTGDGLGFTCVEEGSALWTTFQLGQW